MEDVGIIYKCSAKTLPLPCAKPETITKEIWKRSVRYAVLREYRWNPKEREEKKNPPQTRISFKWEQKIARASQLCRLSRRDSSSKLVG